MFGIFKSNWSKWQPFELSVDNPSHGRYYQEDPLGLGGNHWVDAYQTDDRNVRLIMIKRNSRNGKFKLDSIYVGTYHKDKVPTFEEVVQKVLST